mmetsp:Transcript_61901/g.100113  ORF Transcript_61901/g.100113 Transcript_61901/m.100113 type:complete len:82 (+) Transcript_61901:129-374(+)
MSRLGRESGQTRGAAFSFSTCIATARNRCCPSTRCARQLQLGDSFEVSENLIEAMVCVSKLHLLSFMRGGCSVELLVLLHQ